METIVADITCNPKEDEKIYEKAGEILRAGGLVAFPTETVYGLGADALDEAASAKIYAAKGRPSDNPLIVHIADMDAVYKLASEVPEAAVKLADKFWPGPLTMILKKIGHSSGVDYRRTWNSCDKNAKPQGGSRAYKKFGCVYSGTKCQYFR